MKIRNLCIALSVMAATLVSCLPQEENLGMPVIKLDKTEMTFEKEVGSSELAFVATRDWMVENDAEWLVVSPESGKAMADVQLVTISVLENTGMDRSADVKFTIGMASSTLTVYQKGPGGSAEALIVYSNDYDKEVAEKTYGGSGSSWPYLDQFEGWKNETGTGAENVTYSFSGMSARANSTSSSDYSDYEGSGNNNMFFGKNAYLAAHGIALDAATGFTLTFGSEKYSQDGDSHFKNSEFHVYLSNDGKKWVELDYVFAGTEPGRWNVAKADFSVPEGTNTLSICVKTDVASVYRMDDLKLVISEGGKIVDFAAGVEMDFGAGSTTDQPVKPDTITDVTVAEFNEKAVSTTEWYRLTGVVGGPINTTYGNYDLIDETGTVYVYGTSNWSEYSSEFAEGGKVTIVGQRGDYNGKIEVLESYIESYVPGEGGSETPGEDDDDTPSEEPGSLTKVTVAEFLAAAESTDVWYELTGQIINIANETYGNLTIKDETGEVYLYGLTKTYVEKNDKSFASIGVSLGDYVTVAVQRGSYSGNPQGTNAYYLSHEEGELELGETVDFAKVSSEQDDWTGTYLIVMADGKAHGAVSGKDFVAVSDELEEVSGVISTYETYAVKVAALNDGYSIELPDGKYLSLAHNSSATSSAAVEFDITYTDAGVKISAIPEGKSDPYYLYSNTNNGNYFRFYVEKDMEGYSFPTLYKK